MNLDQTQCHGGQERMRDVGAHDCFLLITALLSSFLPVNLYCNVIVLDW